MSSSTKKQSSSGNGDHKKQPDSTADQTASEQLVKKPSSGDSARGSATAATYESASEQPLEKLSSGDPVRGSATASAFESASEQPAEEPSSSDPDRRSTTAATFESASEQPLEEPVSGRTTKNPAAVALGRLGGLKGGKARAQKLTAGERSEAARKAANARWRKTKPSK